MPRKKSVQTKEVPTENVETLKREIEELRNALSSRYSEANAVAEAKGAHDEGQMVVIENCSSSTVSIPYEYLGRNRTLMLDTTGVRQQGALPLEVWIALERDSKMVSEGFIRRIDRPSSNPNVIVDLAEFVKSIRETDITARLVKITNPSVLYRLYNWLELKPREERTGKEVKMMQSLRERIFEVTQVRIVDGDID